MTRLRKIGLIGFAAITLISIVLAFFGLHKISLPFLMPFAVMLLIDYTRKKP